MPAPTNLCEEALALEPAARAELAERLLESLDGEAEEGSVDAAWAVECEARLAAHRRGEIETVGEEEVFRRTPAGR